jgi:Pretoxin HINT domain
VLLANGKAVPISSLHVGEMVLATNTRTGDTQPEAVAAVLVHHDTDLYALKIRDRGRTSVIDTTSSHLFWIPGSAGGDRWAKAASLKYGTYLRTPDGGTAVVAGGYVPRQRSGWMWDLTVPGNNDHDFYIDTMMQGPKGEPWQQVEGFDDDGDVQEIQYHNGHSFDDGTSFGPHYKNPVTGFHYFWDES